MTQICWNSRNTVPNWDRIDMLREKIIEVLQKKGDLHIRELARELEVNKNLRKEFRKTLESMEREGLLFQTKKERYRLTDGRYQLVGELQGTRKGMGFVLVEGGKDIFIPGRNLHGALHGDTVLVHILDQGSPGESPTGEVLKVLKRGKVRIIGTFRDEGRYAFVVPDDEKYFKDIYVEQKDFHGAEDGQKVVAKITKWPKGRKNPEGFVDEVLGFPSDKGVDVLSIARGMGFPMDFPKKVLKEASVIPKTVEKSERKGRRDLRDQVTFTIDGADSKDFDDAVSICRRDNGNYLLGVHIADVAHYVPPRSALDREAYRRGNSVYLLDRVIPMLPEALSNGICSLNEGVDRLTMTVEMEVDQNGSLIRHDIFESVIRSRKRLVYTDVSDFLENGKVHPSLKGLTDSLKTMEELAKILRKKRDSRGSIDFDLPEREITLDDQGIPLRIALAERRTANRLIEEFMLLANETVAEQYFWLDVPFLYRIHEQPAEEKIQALNQILRPFGHKLRHTDDVKPMEIKELLSSIEGREEYPLVEMLVLRSLKKARYSEKMEGHFGLASNYYTHFTSPIRRYNDLMIHRIMKDVLHGSLSMKKAAGYEKILPSVAEHISATEKLAQEGERAVEDIKTAQYMADRIGEVYEGRISGITGFGLFVQLENTVEGLVRYDSMDGYVVFDEDAYKAVSTKDKKEYTLGQRVKVEVVGATPLRGQIDFILR